MQPPAFGRVRRDAVAAAARFLPKRQGDLAAFQVPQGGVDGRHGQRGDCADGGGMGQKQQIAPDPLQPVRVVPDQRRGQRPFQKRHDRWPARPERTGTSRAAQTVAVIYRRQRCLLADEGLDRIDAFDLSNQIDHPQLDALAHRHLFASSFPRLGCPGRSQPSALAPRAIRSPRRIQRGGPSMDRISRPRGMRRPPTPPGPAPSASRGFVRPAFSA